MFEDMTPESIKKSILDRIGSELQTREGSFLANLVSPVSQEIWKLYQSLNAIVSIAYVDEGSGGYIDLRCAEYGISRKPGTRARAVIELTGTAGAVIPEGTAFLTAAGLVYRLTEDTTLAGGTGQGTIEAEDVGTAYNVAAGEISQMVVTLPTLTAWSNGAAAGGTDPETDAALVERLYSYLQRPATSGNAYHYEQWAREAAGVGAAKVEPLWNGPGTVKVLLVGPEKEPVAPEIVQTCAAHIEELRPIGASVSVESAKALTIDVAAAVTTDGSVTAAQVQEKLAAALGAYLRGISFVQYTLLYNRVAFLLLDVDGVIDYIALTVNGGTDNVVIGPDQVPVLGKVTVT